MQDLALTNSGKAFRCFVRREFVDIVRPRLESNLLCISSIIICAPGLWNDIRTICEVDSTPRGAHVQDTHPGRCADVLSHNQTAPSVPLSPLLCLL